MAIPFARMEPLGLARGSPVERATYVLRLRHRRARTGVLHDHTARGDLVSSELLLPPAGERWRGRPLDLFEALEASAPRVNALLGLDFVLALPGAGEATPEEGVEMVRSFALCHLVEPYGLGVVYAIHEPGDEPQINATDDELTLQENFHAHLVATACAVEEEGFGARADGLLPVQLGATTIDAMPWRTLWPEHLDRTAARLGRSWHVRRPAPVAGRHVGPAAARMVTSLELRAGRDGRLNSRIEAANREATRDAARLLDALGERPFTPGDVERLVERYAGLDHQARRRLVGEVLSRSDCVRLVDPDAGSTPWHARLPTILTEEEAIAAARRLAAGRPPANGAWPPPADRQVVVVRLGRERDAPALRAAILAGEAGPRGEVIALGHGAGTLAPWHRAGCALLDLRRVPVVVPARGALVVMDGAERAGASALLDALQLAEAARCRLILVRHPRVAAPLLDRIARHCGEVVFGAEDPDFGWRAALSWGDAAAAVRLLAAEGAVRFAPDPRSARDLAEDLVLSAGDGAVLLGADMLARHAATDAPAPPPVPRGARLVILHDPASAAPLLPLAEHAASVVVVADRMRTPDAAALGRQAAASLGPRNACLLMHRALASPAAQEDANAFSLWCGIERALIRRRAVGMPDAWPGAAARLVSPGEAPDLPFSPGEVETMAREEREFGALWRSPAPRSVPGPETRAPREVQDGRAPRRDPMVGTTQGRPAARNDEQPRPGLDDLLGGEPDGPGLQNLLAAEPDGPGWEDLLASEPADFGGVFATDADPGDEGPAGIEPGLEAESGAIGVGAPRPEDEPDPPPLGP